MTDPAVRLTGLTRRFGALTAVDDLDLRIDRGEVVALLGPNGAGKSTTIDLALGLSHPTAGRAELFGGTPQSAISTGRVGAMLQGGALLPTMTVRESVALIAGAHRHPLPVDEALRRAGASDIARQRVSKLSGGETQRARFAVAIVSDPELLVLDEPTAAMDVEARRLFWDSMHAFAAEGRTVVFATHYLEEADAFADRIVILSRGHVVADGTPSEVKSVVSGRAVSLTVDDPDAAERTLGALPGVSGLVRHGSRIVLTAEDSDAVLRRALADFPDARGIEVVARTMDDAFLALTSPHDGDSPTASADASTTASATASASDPEKEGVR